MAAPTSPRGEQGSEHRVSFADAASVAAPTSLRTRHALLGGPDTNPSMAALAEQVKGLQAQLAEKGRQLDALAAVLAKDEPAAHPASTPTLRAGTGAARALVSMGLGHSVQRLAEHSVVLAVLNQVETRLLEERACAESHLPSLEEPVVPGALLPPSKSVLPGQFADLLAEADQQLSEKARYSAKLVLLIQGVHMILLREPSAATSLDALPEAAQLAIEASVDAYVKAETIAYFSRSEAVLDRMVQLLVNAGLLQRRIQQRLDMVRQFCAELRDELASDLAQMSARTAKQFTPAS